MIKRIFYGFRRKIFLGISVIMMTMIILLGITIYFSVQSGLERNQKQNLNNINQVLVNSIDTCIMDMKNAIFYIISSDDLTVLSLPEYFGSNEFFASQKAFEVLLTSFGKSRDFDSIYLFVPENGMVVSQNTYDSIWASTPDGIKGFEAYKQISEQDEDLGVLSDITKVSNYNANIFGVYYKITEDVFIEVTMDKKFFDNILKDVFGKHFEYVIIEGAHDELVFTNSLEFTNKLDAINVPEKEEGSSRIKVGKESYITSCQISPESGWIITTYTSYEVIKASTWEISRLMVIITAGFVLLVLAFAYLLSMTLSMNARKLAATMKSAPESDYKAIERVNSNDEFGEISDSFIDMMNELVKNKIHAKDMQLRVLQQQINPHFLYNTFDVLSYFIMNDEKDNAIEMIEKLSDMFRYNVYSNDQHMTSIRNEVENLENYLFIIQTRMGDTLKVEWDIDEKILSFNTPKFILQPIVENALKHGFKKSIKLKKIIIKGIMTEDDIIFEIRDNGIGLAPNRLEEVRAALKIKESNIESEFGIGLLNINSRLQLDFGEMYGVNIESLLGKGTKVSIRIPKNEAL